MKNHLLITLLVTNISVSVAKVANQESFITKISNAITEITGSIIWNLDSSGLSGITNESNRLGEAVSHGDYNGDGIQDLAIGIPGYDADVEIGQFTNSGTVLIIYGSPSGLASSNHQFLFQTFASSPATLENLNGVEDNDFFGQSLASGDFNCDGITDLAVGTPEEDIIIVGETREQVGAVNIFYGSTNGFSSFGQGSKFFFRGSANNNSPIFMQVGDRFGWSMAAENFDGLLCDDLVVSAPFVNISSAFQAGEIRVYYGTSSGISEFDNHSISQSTDGLSETAPGNFEKFGFSLAAGHLTLFGGVGVFDLVVGIPGNRTSGESLSGAIQIFMGSAAGLNQGAPSEIWSQAGNIAGVVESQDSFGSFVTVGNFNGDSLDDVAIGVPGEDLNSEGIIDAGSINIIYGGQFGLETNGNQSFHQNSLNIDGVAEESDQFGKILASGDLNGDSFDDLVIGVPRENNSKGAFHILFGSSDGLVTVDSIFEKNLGDGEELDEMGIAMTIANFGKGKQLAVGIPGDNSANLFFNDSGSVEVFEFPQPLPDLIFAGSFEG